MVLLASSSIFFFFGKGVGGLYSRSRTLMHERAHTISYSSFYFSLVRVSHFAESCVTLLFCVSYSDCVSLLKPDRFQGEISLFLTCIHFSVTLFRNREQASDDQTGPFDGDSEIRKRKSQVLHLLKC